MTELDYRFVVIAATRDMARKVFNSPAYVKPCVVDVAYKLLGADYWVFLDGPAHIAFRKGLNGLFTRKALQSYLPGQEEVYRRYLRKFLKVTEDAGGKPVPFMPHFRVVMCAVSLRTFCGTYISDEAVKKIADDYYLITAALELVNFPIILPFTKTWYRKRSSDDVLAEFSKASAKSKVRMAVGGEPTCIMDAWIKNSFASKKWLEAEAKGLCTENFGEKPTVLSRESPTTRSLKRFSPSCLPLRMPPAVLQLGCFRPWPSDPTSLTACARKITIFAKATFTQQLTWTSWCQRPTLLQSSGSFSGIGRLSSWCRTR